MKKFAIIAAAAVIGAAIAFGFANVGTAKALNVNEVGTDPGAFTGSITITGITAGVSQYDKTVIGIMDIKELQCTTPNCNKIYIPVKFPDRQPAMGDEIRATGQFQKLPQGYLFVAQKITVVKNHKIGG